MFRPTKLAFFRYVCDFTILGTILRTVLVYTQYNIHIMHNRFHLWNDLTYLWCSGGHGGPRMSTGATGRLHRLLTRRFIPKGNDVFRVLIHLLSRIFHRQGSRLCTWSMTITVTFVWECASVLKCADTGESSILLCMMSKWWLLICSGGVAPFRPHTVGRTSYM